MKNPGHFAKRSKVHVKFTKLSKWISNWLCRSWRDWLYAEWRSTFQSLKIKCFSFINHKYKYEKIIFRLSKETFNNFADLIKEDHVCNFNKTGDHLQNLTKFCDEAEATESVSQQIVQISVWFFVVVVRINFLALSMLSERILPNRTLAQIFPVSRLYKRCSFIINVDLFGLFRNLKCSKLNNLHEKIIQMIKYL